MASDTTTQRPEPGDLLARFEKAVRNSVRVHTEYIGKAMADQVYQPFARLRDETIPALRAELAAALAGALPLPPAAPAWRCFHCDERFTDTDSARAHFGDSERQQALCTIDPTHFRWMEAQHRQTVDECDTLSQTVRSLANEHETLRRRAEELGYARGLADAKKHPEELGLTVIPNASSEPSEWVAFERWINRVRPSGDCEAVTAQWHESVERAEWIDAAKAEPWRVGEFISSARRPENVLMLAVGEKKIAEYGAHRDFVRWVTA